jgi:hypothetical protein
MTIESAFLLGDQALCKEAVVLCTTFAEVEHVHRAESPHNVMVPALAVPDPDRPLFVYLIGGRAIATNGLYAFCLLRARGVVRIGNTVVQPGEFAAAHCDLRSLEDAILSRAEIGEDIGLMRRWAESCREPIDQRHRRLSTLRAALLMTEAGSNPWPAASARIVDTIDSLIAKESRGAWA